MYQFSGCPRCHQQISEDRKRSVPVICNSCGFVDSASDEDARETFDKQFLTWSIGVALLIVAGFLQLASWDNHFADVIPLQVKELVGAATNADLEEMASICLERKKLDCVEREYAKLGERDPHLLLRLGQFQMARAHYNEAVNTYRTFFTLGGIDLEGSYNFARALGQVGMVDEAAKYYDYVLGAKPDVLQVTVIHNYVKLLMEAHRLDQAKRLIESVRAKSQESSYFMDDEFKQIQSQTGTKS